MLTYTAIRLVKPQQLLLLVCITAAPGPGFRLTLTASSDGLLLLMLSLSLPARDACADPDRAVVVRVVGECTAVLCATAGEPLYSTFILHI